ncbi:PREDICTED: nuclear factor NF-kappa-B p110 subunit [Dufourea novaeangliae]|uniref:nuclear factor NF-kappa-B p110 subunit n=1 Tax=Dufourea novaeangliae TaxID=178035 RepID=UPI00076727EA|nr:PREDICTED: nuclear factor NF-kappa-B p110 subunit [Dufourea novaeangliae]
MPEVFENYMVFQNVSENQDYFPYGHDLQTMNNQGMFSPFNGSQGTSAASPISSSLSPMHDIDCMASLKDVTVIGEPYIKILEQPVEKFRFRYKSEMIGTHGSLVGTNSGSSRNKHAPTVQLHNCPTSAVIRCTLVTSDEGHRIPHAHRLVRRVDGVDCDDPHDIKVTPENRFIATFHGMGIIHTARKHVREELIKKMRKEALEKNKRKHASATLSTREEAQIKADVECYQKSVNLNTVALCFQAFLLDERDVMIPLTEPVYSHAINNLKSALTGELKICRMDKYTSSADGGEEVFLLVEKVGRKNIRIKFFEVNEDDNEIWCAYGRFSELDVHHQFAIVFRTPPYRDQNITSSKEVFIQLERPSDSDCSEPMNFTYKPSDRVIGRKRQRMSHSGSTELSYILPTFNVEPGNISANLSGDSGEVSKELQRMLLENSSSPEAKEFLNHMDIEGYLKYVECNDENMLTADGPSSKRYEDDIMFPKSILVEVTKCIKMDSKSTEEHVRKLLRNRSTYGDSPLHAALRYGQRDIVKYILMLISTDKDCKTLVNEQNSSGKTPLHYAVLQNQPEITKALLMLGADPNQSDEHGCSPLHAAVKNPQAAACVDALLSEKKVDTETHNDAGWTPLHLAAEAGSYNAVCLLVQAGANVNNTDMSYGRTVLHIAVEGGHKEIVEYLLKKTNIAINKRNFSGNTALHTAVVYSGVRAKELCALLIKYGADPHIQNHNRELNDVEKRKGSHIHVKQEVDSDDETTEECTGQSSFDLAMSKPDILQLLNSQTGEVPNEMGLVSTKLEVVDEELQKNLLNTEQKEKLSVILDKTQGWRQLAKRLKFDYFLKTLQQCSLSPSLLLLNYIDVQTTMSLADMESILRDIGENEAANYVNEISFTHQ